MPNHTTRDEQYLSRLTELIRREYDIAATHISPAKRGYYGETWRLDTLGNSYFVKLDYTDAHKRIYQRSFPIVQHLCDHGIDFINKIVKTKDGKLSTLFDGAVLGVFDWIDGENIETDETKIPEYAMLAKVYTVTSDGLDISKEDFSGDSAGRFYARWDVLADAPLCRLFERHRMQLEHRGSRLNYFARLCKGDSTGFFITHGDAGGNLIVSGDKHYIVDWDAPMLAPPERDAWVMLCYETKSDWVKRVFHKALRDVGISYAIRPERLAYYAYYTFFFYLNEYLDGYNQISSLRDIEDYFHCWTENRIEYADKIRLGGPL